MSSTVIRLEQLEVGYGGRPLLPPVELTIQSAQFWGVVGSNGSGKSTLLRTILGLMPMVSGSVARSADVRVGYVPQRMSLDLNMPARAIDVVRGGASWGWSYLHPFHTFRKGQAIDSAMEQTGVRELAFMQLSELSEGQKQRVLMARALVCQPHLLILDEPTSAMDSLTEQNMLQLLDRIRREQGVAILLVSHNLMAMGSVATHALMLDREHQLILSGDIREVAVHHEVHEHFGRLLRSVVEERFGPLPDPEECHDCHH